MLQYAFFIALWGVMCFSLHDAALYGIHLHHSSEISKSGKHIYVILWLTTRNRDEFDCHVFKLRWSILIIEELDIQYLDYDDSPTPVVGSLSTLHTPIISNFKTSSPSNFDTSDLPIIHSPDNLMELYLWLARLPVWILKPIIKDIV